MGQRQSGGGRWVPGKTAEGNGGWGGGEFGRGTMGWPSSPKGTFPDNLLMDYAAGFYGAEVKGEKFTCVWLSDSKIHLPLPVLKSYSQIKIWIGA